MIRRKLEQCIVVKLELGARSGVNPTLLQWFMSFNNVCFIPLPCFGSPSDLRPPSYPFFILVFLVLSTIVATLVITSWIVSPTLVPGWMNVSPPLTILVVRYSKASCIQTLEVAHVKYRVCFHCGHFRHYVRDCTARDTLLLGLIDGFFTCFYPFLLWVSL